MQDALELIKPLLNAKQFQLFVYCGVVFGLVLLGARWLEGNIVDRSKAKTATWLESKKFTSLLVLSINPFINVFDRVFGNKHFSLRCFFLSAALSFFAVFFMLILLGIVTGGINLALDLLSKNGGKFLLALVLINVIPDYFSLYESRYLFGKLNNDSSIKKFLAVLFFDFILTCLIFIVVMPIMFIVTNALYSNYEISVSKTIDNFNKIFSFIVLSKPVSGLLGQVEELIYRVLFYSTFITSVCLWLFAITAVFINITGKLSKVEAFYKRHFTIKQKPFMHMAYVLNSIILLLCTIIALFI